MKYSIGDKVRVKSIDWYNQMLSIPNKVVWQNKLSEEFVGIWCGSKIFYEDMCKFCANIMTIQNIGNDYYIMEEDSCGHEFNDEMLKGKVEERPSMMKYKKGDKVRIKDKIEDDWFYRGQNKEDVYIPQVIKDGISEGCGKIMTIAFVNESQKLYMMKEHWGHAYTDEMIEGLVEVKAETKSDTSSNPIVPKSNANSITQSESDAIEKAKTYWDSIKDAWICPEGYEFRDENGNVIEATKIILEKKPDNKLKLESTKKVREYWSEYTRIFIEIYDDEPNECILTHLYTLEGYRQKGYGKQALIQAEEIAKELGCHIVHLKVQTNSWMHKWYLRCGYKWYNNAPDNYTWLTKNLNDMEKKPKYLKTYEECCKSSSLS